MQKLKHFWIKLTAWLPRPLPKTEEEALHLVSVLEEHFGIEATYANKYMVLSHLQNTPIGKKRSYQDMLDVVAKLNCATAAENAKRKIVLAQAEEANQKLALETPVELKSSSSPAADDVQSGPHPVTGDVPPVQVTEDGVVRLS